MSGLSGFNTAYWDILPSTPTPPAPTYYNTEQQATASCPNGFEGDSQTRTVAAGTYSASSLDAANQQAYNAALAQATAALVCTRIRPNYDPILVGPSAEGAGVTLSGADNDKLGFFARSSGDSLPFNMVVLFGGNPIASVDFLSRYAGDEFGFEHNGTWYYALFANGNVTIQ